MRSTSQLSGVPHGPAGVCGGRMIVAALVALAGCAGSAAMTPGRAVAFDDQTTSDEHRAAADGGPSAGANRPSPAGAAGLHRALPAGTAGLNRALPGGAAALAELLPDSIDAGVPTPKSIIGHPLGNRAARYADVERYMHALAEASPLVTITPYADSHEGRSLYYLTITSPANHDRLAQIRADNAKLADPRKLGEGAAADEMVETMPAVAWLGYSIHGDEMSGTDASMLVAYALAAGTDEATRRLRDELVIHVDPSMNPDGRERYLGQLEPLTGKVPSTDYQAMQHAGLWSAGRGNHYLFDLNRDWLPMVHPETRGRAAAMLQWNPHLVIDAHEMGSLDTYLFDPPREPRNVNLSETNLRWRRMFSADQARAFDRYGWSYYTQEWYEEWYPGYTNAWANLLGAVGLLYEQAGVNGAAVRRHSGEVLTYAEAVAHQFASTLANLETLRANRQEILRDYFEDRRWAVSSPGEAGQKVFVAATSADAARFERFCNLLSLQGIEFERAAGPVVAEDAVSIWGETSERVQLPAGSVVVRVAQPHRRLLRAILEFDPHMSDRFLHEERKSLESRDGSRLYDVTAWNLPMACGLKAWWADSVSTEPAGGSADKKRDFDPFASPPAYGFLIDGRSSDIYPAIARILERGGRIRVAQKPFAVGDRDYQAGTLLLRNHENPPDLPQLVSEAAEGLSLIIQPAETALCQSGPDLGGNEFRLLELPRVAIASQWPISTTSFGAIWHLLDARVGLRTSPINTQSLGRIDLRRYNVLVLPNAWGRGGLGAILNDGTREHVRRWIEAGGTLVAVGGSAAFLADKDHKLSSVRLRRDVLDKLKVYDEAVARERAARDVKVDPDIVWGRGDDPDDAREAAATESAEAEADGEGSGGKSTKKVAGKGEGGKDVESLKREDAWRRVFSPSGVFVRADLNPDHWLCFGLGDRLPVLVGGSTVFMSSHPVATPARLSEATDLRLAGLLWPEAKARLADSAYATVERVGRGQVILFAGDPDFRGYMAGSSRLLLNAIILGPGLGTSTPVPW